MSEGAAPAPRRRKAALVDTHYRLPAALHRKLRAEAFKRDRPQAELVVEAVDRYLNGGT